MKVLFLTPYPTKGASNRLRVEQFLPYLSDQGIRYRLRPFVFPAFYEILYQRGKIIQKAFYFLLATLSRICDLARIMFADVVFIHREAYPIGPPLFEWIVHLLRKPIVYDFDDAIFLPSSSPPNTFMERFKWPSKVASIIRWSSCVIAGNDYLAAFARQFNERVVVIPTCIETTKYRPKLKQATSSDKVVIGWIGSITTQEFLGMLDEVYKEVAGRYDNVEFFHIGGSHTVEGLENKIVNMHWDLQRELEDLQSIDIGVMPLPDTPWTRGKCGFKAIQYMAVGIPAVCSPVGVTTKIVDHGHNGFLVRDKEEWVETLGRLIENRELRERIGKAARKKVETHYSVSTWALQFCQVLRDALALRRPFPAMDSHSSERGLFDRSVINPDIMHHEDIICFSSIDWDFIWQMPQEIVSRLADNGNRVLFVENTGVRNPQLKDASRVWRRLKNWRAGRQGIRHVRSNLAVYSPLVLPFPYLGIVQRFNAFLMRRAINRWSRLVGFNNPIIVTFLPTRLTLQVIKALDHKLIVYYCADNFPASSKGASKIVKSEEELVREADLVLVTSEMLKERFQRIRPDVYQYPSGVSLEPFELARQGSVKEPLLNCPSPRIGYIGGLHKWIDWSLLADVISRSPEWSFVFVGPIQSDEAKQLAVYPNVWFVGARPHHEIASYVREFDVCLIPYKITDYTENVYPVKMNEYFAMGKPVVSTPLKEVKKFNETFGSLVVLAQKPEEFKEAIAKCLNSDDEASVLERYKVAEANSYESRLKDISRLVERAVGVRLKKQEQEWSVWSSMRGSIWKSWRLVTILGVLALYLTIFYTRVPWVIGYPLKIDQPPKKSDAIVVFGGGVGETGVFGKSTFERTRFAVKLYKEGYAPYIIFSTGFVYDYKEAEDMMLLATSLGVPRERIIIEDKSSGTFQNVRYVMEIIRKMGFGKIILVSAPYHMKRSQLLFSRYPDLQVTYTPAPSSFYESSETMNFQQFKSLIWEYAAIVYYKYKGYF